MENARSIIHSEQQQVGQIYYKNPCTLEANLAVPCGAFFLYLAIDFLTAEKHCLLTTDLLDSVESISLLCSWLVSNAFAKLAELGEKFFPVFS